MTRLFLLFHGRFPSEKAASLFAAKSAEAFARQGLDVTVVVPRRRGVRETDVFDYYRVERNFRIAYVPTIDAFAIPGMRFFAFWLSYLAFSLYARRYLSRESAPEDVIYSNEILPLYFASKIRPNAFYEMHDFPESKLGLFGTMIGRVRWVLVHNKWKAERLKEVFSFPPERLLCEPNAVDIDAFDLDLAAEDARTQLSLPLDKKIVAYTGHLYGWKGADVLARAAELLPSDVLVAFVGGTEKDVASFREKHGHSSKIRIVGHRPHKEIPLWQKAADVFALPNTAKEAISLYYTSPMKLFEYMVSKRPIVASDIPSVREIVDESCAYLVTPDDAAALAKGVLSALGDPKGALARAMEARRRVGEHTWEKRALRILSFMNRTV